MATLMIGALVSGITSPLIVAKGQTITQKQVDFKMEMRRLWEDHVTYTRMVIVEAAANVSDPVTVPRLLKNQEDIGNAIKPYYGDAAGNQLTALLKQHIVIAADVLNAAKAGNSTALDASLKQWYANADKIALFLSQANPTYWPESAVKSMLYTHLNLTTAEAVARLHGDWTTDIQTYDKIVTQAMMMADALADGIIGQFPGMFC